MKEDDGLSLYQKYPVSEGERFDSGCLFYPRPLLAENKPGGSVNYVFRMNTFKFPFTKSDEADIRDILLKRNGCIIYPTETFYALGCAANLPTAVNKIYTLKKRNQNQPLLVLVDSWEMLNRFTLEIHHGHIPLLKRHWPGPLTAILHQNGQLAKELNYQGTSLGFRMTSSPIAQSLIKIIGIPLVGTSANRTSEVETSDCDSAQAIFTDSVEIYIDGGKTPGILPSTLIDMTTERYSVVRKGMISI